MSEPRDIHACFTEDTSNHVLTVLRDDGLYRHLTCGKPGTIVYRFDIITWPGYLAYVGDMGDYVFRRIPDMFSFFGSDGINPDYWSEKVVAECRDRVREFSVERYRERVEEWRDDLAEGMEDGDDLADFFVAVDEDLLGVTDGMSESEAYERLRDFYHEGVTVYDPSDWYLRGFTWRYIWACYAITWAIGRYRDKEDTK